MPAACTRWRTPTRPPPHRSVRCGRLPAGQAMPLFVFDGGYDSAQLTLDLAEERVAVRVRLRSDRCFYADPPPAAHSPRAAGRAATGPSSPSPTRPTWPTPSARLVCQDDQSGTVTVQAWDGLHPKQQRHPGHGTDARLSTVMWLTCLARRMHAQGTAIAPAHLSWWSALHALGRDSSWSLGRRCIVSGAEGRGGTNRAFNPPPRRTRSGSAAPDEPTGPLGGRLLAKCLGQLADLGFWVAAVTAQGLQEGQLAFLGPAGHGLG
jgi:DDE superfamily endonuclease